MNHARSHFSRVRAFLVACCLAAVPLIGQSANWDRYTDFAWNVGTGNISAFPNQGSGQMWQDWKGARTPTATGPQFTGPTKALPFNPSPTANFKAKFSPAKMAKALFNPVNAIPFFATSALQALLNEACVRVAGGQMQVAPGGQWEECNMVTQTAWQYSVAARPNASYTGTIPDWQSSRTAVCNKVKTSIQAQCAAGNGGSCPNSYNATIDGDISTEDKPGTCTVKNMSFYNLVVYQEGLISQQTSSVVQDGWKPATASVAESKATTKMNDWTQADFLYGYQARPNQNLADVVDAIIESGNKIELEPGSVSVTGQTSLPGAPKTETTTNPDGTTVTKTVNTVNNYSYGPTTTDNRITITHNTTTTTNTTNNATSQTTTTTTQEETPPDTAQCEKYPDTLGCAKFGTPEAGTPIVKDSQAVTITPATFSGGTCPAPVSFVAFGRSYALEYAPLCNRLAGLAPLFLALSALLAAWIFADGFRVT